jgi:broad specificity phosphatase PhoE
MRRLYLARHGETEWNAIGRLQGGTDIPLNDRGREHGRALAKRLAARSIAEVITSDLSRARETGEIVARELGLPPPRIVPALRERAFGVFEGLTRDQCQHRYPEAWKRWHEQTGVPEGAEGLAEATDRMHGVLAELAEGDGGPAVVISHGGVMRLWLVDLHGRHVAPLANGITYVCDRIDSGWTATLMLDPA